MTKHEEILSKPHYSMVRIDRSNFLSVRDQWELLAGEDVFQSEFHAKFEGIESDLDAVGLYVVS
ncbi:hypothetical protein CPHO_06700 [Corynebacterium phocae]|uniref:Uncharacterized protein n=1 Tax=Corynebacterium phocae TaxID=161895 RepID=A0A1L7D3D3_9CORY|nr:hypothetical protein [Corynebacterium phocae]APT92634.1 hypothetical protein CPHO_06700 [Corynebacterium phocae]KAA8724191.1 hypothetical protein F4V58_06240 [Corynebacterium phocae]